MNPNNLLAIAGIAATVMLGGWAIYLAVRRPREVGIAYLEDTCLSLIDDITQGIGNLEIRFRNSPVSQNIVLLKGYIINTGKRDISPNMVEKRLRLVLPEGFKWIDCQITGRADSLKIQVAHLTSENIEFDFGLFKTQEYFKFDALATVPIHVTPKEVGKPPDAKLREALRFDYRIVDTRDIQKLRLRDLQAETLSQPRVGGSIHELPLASAFRFYSWLLKSFWMGFGVILMGIGFYVLFAYVQPKDIGYEISGPDNRIIATTTRVKDERIEMYNREGFRKTMSPKEFDELRKKTIVLQPASGPGWIIMSSVYIALGLLMLLAWIIRFARIRKYRQILHLAKP